MGKSKFSRVWFVLVTIISLVSTIIFKFADNWFNIKNSMCLEVLGVGYDISLSIITALIAFFAIDRVLEKRKSGEEKSRKKAIYNKLIPGLKKFYQLYIDLYAGTRVENVDESDPALLNIFVDKEQLYIDIRNNVDLLNDSPYIDIARFNREEFFEKSKEYTVPYLKWYVYIINCYVEIYNKLRIFKDSYIYFLTTEVIENIDRIMSDFESVQFMINSTRQVGVDIFKEKEKNGKFIFWGIAI